ncbi:hypothetical protein FEP63_04442 [Burkholderia multivorans]|nr:hypothetical protein [Burkholderia multivorans]MDR8882409.1 hypothetical protein [Burkholderia multivorans]MDR8888769.1 hypothetical protein [Burkholderia multivorans]MDR8895970.1 hypothetical protein [Burkholderia multivorans]MDR8901997.1 hypothetical protein [Burkholderia multivorans]
MASFFLAPVFLPRARNGAGPFAGLRLPGNQKFICVASSKAAFHIFQIQKEFLTHFVDLGQFASGIRDTFVKNLQLT